MRKLATSEELWAIAFLWACFSLIAFSAIYGEPLDPGGWLRLPMALGLGLLGLAPFVVFGILQFAIDRIRQKIAYHRLSALERFAFRINSRTEPGFSERKALEKRLVTIADSTTFRQTIYHDPLNDQFWLSVYWQQGHYDGVDLKPLDEGQKDEALRRLEAARKVSAASAKDA